MSLLEHNKWDLRFMSLAMEVRSWSKDPDHRVGAVLVSPDRREFAVGYNGLPTGFKDENGLLVMAGSLKQEVSWLKGELSLHAEANAINNCRVRPVGWTLYSTRCPCVPCAAKMVQGGIAALVCPPPEPDSRWHKSHLAAVWLLQYGITPRILVTFIEAET